MPKTHTQYVCQQCGRTVARPMGRCPQCGAWNSMVEEIIAQPSKPVHTAGRGLTGASTPRRLTEIEGDADERWALSIGEFARVLCLLKVETPWLGVSMKHILIPTSPHNGSRYACVRERIPRSLLSPGFSAQVNSLLASSYCRHVL